MINAINALRSLASSPSTDSTQVYELLAGALQLEVGPSKRACVRNSTIVGSSQALLTLESQEIALKKIFTGDDGVKVSRGGDFNTKILLIMPDVYIPQNMTVERLSLLQNSNDSKIHWVGLGQPELPNWQDACALLAKYFLLQPKGQVIENGLDVSGKWNKIDCIGPNGFPVVLTARWNSAIDGWEVIFWGFDEGGEWGTERFVLTPAIAVPPAL